MISSIFKAFNDYFRAFGLMGKLKLWKYVFITGLLSFFFGGAMILLAIEMVDVFSSSLISLYPFETGQSYVIAAAKFISALSTVFLGLMVYKYIVFIIFVPFLGPMSEKVEEYLTGEQSGYSVLNIGRFIKDVIKGIAITIRLLVKELFWLTVLFMLSFVPLVGFFVPIIGILIQCFYAGSGNLDLALERHYDVKGRINFTKEYRGLTLGNGIAFTLLLFVPIVGFFLAPSLSVVAATITSIEKIEEEEL